MAEQNNRITPKMHLQLNSRIKPLASLLSIALLTSCASMPESPPAKVEYREVVEGFETLNSVESKTERVTLDYAPLQVESLNTSKGDYYQQQADNAIDKNKQANDALSAAEYYIQEQDYQRVEMAIKGIQHPLVDQVQQDRLSVIEAYSAYARGEYQISLFILQPLWQRAGMSLASLEQTLLNEEDETTESQSQEELPESNIFDIDEPDAINSELVEFSESELTGLEQPEEVLVLVETEIPDAPALSTQQVDALLLASFNFQALNDYDSALEALIQRERSLYGKARAETTRYIWQIVSTLPESERRFIVAYTQNPLVKNRIELSFDEHIGQARQTPAQFNKWRDDDASLPPKTLHESQWSSHSPTQIAVLLPLSSKYSTAATALQDGIILQHSQNESPYKPALKFYDIGDQNIDAPKYYAAAIQSGADFIIGPLGKNYANQISLYSDKRINTLLLGGDIALANNEFRFDLSPEMEGQRIAEHAWKDGHLSTAIISNESSYNRRAITGFSKTWLNLGGKITKKINYSEAQFDHSSELRQLFNIDQSQQRHTQISRILGFKPKFSEYKRNDIDFILMLADAKAGRLLRPQINFFSGSSVPVYATSKIFNGIQDPVNNIDLDKTNFPIMPWVMKSAQITPYAGLLNQLFALGSDAYTVAGNYNQLRQQNSTAISGRTGQISISNNEVINQPVWATFEEGLVTPTDTLGLDITPLSEPNENYSINHNVNGRYNGDETDFKNTKTYNSSSWDKKKSEPKNR